MLKSTVFVNAASEAVVVEAAVARPTKAKLNARRILIDVVVPNLAIFLFQRDLSTFRGAAGGGEGATIEASGSMPLLGNPIFKNVT